MEEDTCALGKHALCAELACFGNDKICHPLEKQGFESLCSVAVGATELVNCGKSGLRLLFSGRKNAQNCFEGTQAIRQSVPARDNCDAGKCCKAAKICPLERVMHFTFLSYGIEVEEGDEGCERASDYYSNDCDWITDGLSDDALVCKGSDVSMDGFATCDITMSATNDVLDLLPYLYHVVFPTESTTVTYESTDGTTYEYTALSQLVIAAYSGGPNQESIVNMAFETLQNKGCFDSGSTGIHLMGHSLGGFLVNALAMNITAAYPDIPLRLTTLGEPALVTEPLQGATAALDFWDTKVRYIAGMVIPSGNTLYKLGFRSYGMYQFYDPVAQLLPAGYYFESESTKMQFLCEVVKDNALQYFVSENGCAENVDNVKNRLPSFPHLGLLDDPNAQEGVLVKLLLSLLAAGLQGEQRKAVSILLTTTASDFREDFLRVFDLHLMRRYVGVASRITENGETCDATSWQAPGAINTC